MIPPWRAFGNKKGIFLKPICNHLLPAFLADRYLCAPALQLAATLWAPAVAKGEPSDDTENDHRNDGNNDYYLHA